MVGVKYELLFDGCTYGNGTRKFYFYVLACGRMRLVTCSVKMCSYALAQNCVQGRLLTIPQELRALGLNRHRIVINHMSSIEPRLPAKWLQSSPYKTAQAALSQLQLCREAH